MKQIKDNTPVRITAGQIAITAVLLAICIASQFLKNTSIYITGPIVNAIIIIDTYFCGMVCGIIISIIAPVTSFFITGSPIMAAVPAMFPCIMLGNIMMVLAVAFLSKKCIGSKKRWMVSLPISIVAGAVSKAAVMGVLISLIVLPNFLPEAMLPKLPYLQLQFSVVQLVTALIGGVYAVIIIAALRRAKFMPQV